MATNFTILQSAVLPYRLNSGRLEVLLITASQRRRWIIPKGHVEAFMTPQDSAAKEAWEEAGILGLCHREPIGTWIYDKRGARHRVEVFVMQVKRLLPHWPEQGIRRRQWCSVQNAAQQLSDPQIVAMVSGLRDFLDCHGLEPPTVLAPTA